MISLTANMNVIDASSRAAITRALVVAEDCETDRVFSVRLKDHPAMTIIIAWLAGMINTPLKQA